MALTKEITYLGLSAPDAYAKIASTTTSDYLDGEDKKWNVNISLAVYSSPVKENALYKTQVSLNGLAITDLTIANYYTEIKKLEEWSDWLDA